MLGVPDPQYVVARSVLLDALEALGDQREAVIVVGAQAIYLHTGAIELAAVPEFTIDADLTIDPGLLQEKPEIEGAMLAAHFRRWKRVGARSSASYCRRMSHGRARARPLLSWRSISVIQAQVDRKWLRVRLAP